MPATKPAKKQEKKVASKSKPPVPSTSKSAEAEMEVELDEDEDEDEDSGHDDISDEALTRLLSLVKGDINEYDLGEGIAEDEDEGEDEGDEEDDDDEVMVGVEGEGEGSDEGLDLDEDDEDDADEEDEEEDEDVLFEDLPDDIAEDVTPVEKQTVYNKVRSPSTCIIVMSVGRSSDDQLHRFRL